MFNQSSCQNTLKKNWKLRFTGTFYILFNILTQVVLTLESVQYFPVVLFIMMYKVVLTFEAVDEILRCDHSNESYWAVLSCGTVFYAVQGGSYF